MQTKCPRCSTIIRTNGVDWEIMDGPCLDLAGTHLLTHAEYCPTLSKIAEPDILLPGVTEGLQVQDTIARLRVVGADGHNSVG